MTDYYVRKSGNDANAGTSPGLAWLTIGKALLAGSPVVGGDRVFVGAGTYREVITVAITPASTVQIIGDVDGAQTGDYGDVVWTGYLTNDTTAPSGSIVLNTNGKSNLAFSLIHFVGSGASPFIQVAAGSQGCTFTACLFQVSGSSTGSGNVLTILTNANTAANCTVDRCIFSAGSTGTAISITLATATGADFDYNVLIQDCLLLGIGGSGVAAQSSGANTFFGGGVKVYNCTIWGHGNGVFANSASLSTSLPAIKVYNSLVAWQSTACLRANTSGQVTEDWNRLVGATVRTNVTAGGNSNSTFNHALLLEFGQSIFQKRGARPFLSPMVGSPLLAFGAQAGGPSVDLFNRARPATYAVGAMEQGPVFNGTSRSRIIGAV